MFSALAPSVGSALFDRAVAEGKIDVDRYRGGPFLDIYAGRVPLVQMSALEPRELFALVEKFNRGFNLRPRHLLRRLLAIRSWSEASGLLWGAVFVLRHRLASLGARLQPAPTAARR
jgi:hypothetical protein